MKRLRFSVSFIVVLLFLVGVVIASADSKTVRTLGDNIVQPNVKIASSLRFSPGPVTVKSGDTITWVHADDTEEPHTVTFGNQADLGDTFEEVFGCGAPGGLCEQALAGHGAFGPVLDAFGPGDAANPVVDEVGDSLLFFAGESITATVGAAPGSTLYYLCAIHPWMQGTVEVK